jgi:hypothetical protein
VALLHQVASRDIAAQVPQTLWGPDQPYHSLWPKNLACDLRFAVPASVAGLLGNNLIPEHLVNPSNSGADENQAVEQIPEGVAQIDIAENEQSNLSEAASNSAAGIDKTNVNQFEDSNQKLRKTSDATKVSQQAKNYKGELRKVQLELDRLAKGINQPKLSRTDGRYPIYVVFSVRSGLISRYGQPAAKVIENEMKRLVEAIGKKPGWGALMFLPDDLQSAKNLGVKPAKPGDPWELKLSLADLDVALAPRGERIGALLIVGGADVVPFHHLPNPIDDQDEDVPSDNPYGTRDANYFTPEWPVGRLPDGAGKDPKLLVSLLKRLRAYHSVKSKPLPWYRRWFNVIAGWLRPKRQNKHNNFGYSAEVWRQASAHVFRPIGDPHKLQISPPRGVFSGNFLNPNERKRAQRSLTGGVPRPEGTLGYFNLHGLIDAPEWYGQRDPHKNGGGIDYPVALRPQDITTSANGKQNGLPKVVFSEACYGLHLDGRTTDQAIALKFLLSGSLAIAGSTCMSYGSVETPLIAADLLGHTFWRLLQDGLPAGEALRQAKITLVEEMDRRQGYLDGEDQKTLISFVLYGDPLAKVNNRGAKTKRIDRSVGRPVEVKTVCERCVLEDDVIPAPAEVRDSVRQVVERYLPGMSDAQIAYAPLRVRCSESGQPCSATRESIGTAIHAGTVDPKTFNGNNKQRLVTLSKQVPRTEGVHTHVARLTLDEEGKLLKLVVSR